MALKNANTSTPSARGARTDGGTPWNGIVLVAMVALAASIVGIFNGFVNDDLQLIANNVRVHDLENWRAWFTLPFWPPPFSPDLYRPLTSVVLAFEYVMGNGSPTVFRVVSYLLYATSAVAVFFLAARLMPVPFATAAAALFAAHPVHVEAVALGVGQSELLVAILAIAMCVMYLDRRRTGRLDRRVWITLSGCYLVACLIKEQGFVLPGFLLVADLCFISEPLPRRLRSLGWGYAALGGIAIGVLLVRRYVLGELGGTFTAEALVGLGVSGRALTMLAVVPQWLRLFVWPLHLRGDYSPQEMVASTSFGGTEALGLFMLLAAAVACWTSRKRAPAISFGIGWSAVALLPVSNVIVPTGILLAERTLFLPSVGVVITIAALSQLVVSARPSESYRRALSFACSALVVLGVARSAERQRVWRDEGTFVGRGVQNAPKSFRMQQTLGDLLFGIDRPQLAEEAYARAIRYSPPSVAWRVRNDFARALHARGETAAEAEQLRASLAQRPDQQLARGDLIVAYLLLGKYDVARAEVDTAIARGANARVFSRVGSLADSAARVHAVAGSVRVGITMGAVTAAP